VARPSNKPEVESETAVEDVKVEAPAEIAGKFRALLVKFSLPPGTYATMLLRELTKSSTESGYQAQLSKESGAVVGEI